MNRTSMTLLACALVIVALLGAWAVFAYTQQAKPAAFETPVVATSTQPAAATTEPTTATHPYGSVTLALGQKASFADVSITPLAIVGDSRCPQGVQCIQAGTV